MSTPFAPRQAAPGQRITYAAAGGTLRTIAATEVDEGRWVIQPETNGDEAAVRRHRLPVDEELAAQMEEEGALEGRLTGDALDRRAAELDIPGRSQMSADQKRAAIAEREAAEAGGENTDTQDGAAAPSQEE